MCTSYCEINCQTDLQLACTDACQLMCQTPTQIGACTPPA
jgi:hypothetical protein